MSHYNPKSWFKLIFEFRKSQTKSTLWQIICILCLYSTCIVILETNYSKYFDFATSTVIHSLLGFVIGLLLVFRTNTAYDRWWEGRKAWGKLINISRSFALKSNALFLKEDVVLRRKVNKLISNYAYALCAHLNDDIDYQELLSDKAVSTEHLLKGDHRPNEIISHVYQILAEQVNNKTISHEQFLALDYEMRDFIDVLGICERIKNTPIPYSYNMFIKKFIFVYVLSLPFALIDDFGYWTIPVSGFVLYVLASLELLAEEIEDPFGSDSNDLPTLEMSHTIKTNLKAIYELD